MNCLHSFKTKTLELNQYQKPDKAPFVIYPGLPCLVESIDEYKNHPENSSTTSMCKHILLGFSMSIISSLKSLENKHEV